MYLKIDCDSPSALCLQQNTDVLFDLLHVFYPFCCQFHRPLQDNLFEWHFSVRGPPDSDFDGGVYHGRIVLPPEYPMKPPSIILLTVRRPTGDLHHPPQRPPPLCLSAGVPLISAPEQNGEASNGMIKGRQKGQRVIAPAAIPGRSAPKWQLSHESLNCHCAVTHNLRWFSENIHLSPTPSLITDILNTNIYSLLSAFILHDTFFVLCCHFQIIAFQQSSRGRCFSADVEASCHCGRYPLSLPPLSS